MCGICGIVALDGSPIRNDDLTAMTAALHHRGPDDRGTWSAPGVALGARRLSILDLSPAGHQPMTSGEWTLVYNGEVYNFRAIRDRLDVPFRSEGDTEVVLEAIRAWGSDAIEQFDGMFALAAWNARTRTLLLARDRFGIKPLLYARVGNEIAFASEARALLTWRPELAEVREDAIEEWVTFRHVAGERTLFRGIQRVLPGEILQFTTEGRTPSSALPRASAADAAWADEGVRPSITRSVHDQLVADVPVGTLCSGGIDSSLITMLAARDRSTPLHTFSVSFPGFELDESDYAAAVAQRAGTIHHVHECDPHSLADDFVALTRHTDEPIMHPNSIPLHQVCRLARNCGVIVLLAGEGADELFGGYPRFIAARKLGRVRRWQRLPLAKHIRWSKVPIPDRWKAAAYKLAADSDDLVLLGNAMTSSQDVAALLGRRPHFDFEFRRAALARTRTLDLAERVRQYDLDTYLPPLLQRQDAMSMAASVEARVPMLGNAVASHALATPSSKLARGADGKLPLREIAYDLLPHRNIDRRKIGFNTPTGQWLRAWGEMLDLLTPTCRASAFIDPRVITRLVAEHRDGERDRGELLWTILALEVWLREMAVSAQ